MLRLSVPYPVTKEDEYQYMENTTSKSEFLLVKHTENDKIPSADQLLKSSAYRKVLFMSFCFFMIFIGFLTIQNFQTTYSDPELQDIGTNSLAIIYITFMFSSLFTGKIVDRIGLKNSMILSAPTFALYCAYNLKPSAWFAYIAAFLHGIGGSMIWTANGAWIAIAVQEFESSGMFKSESVTGIFNGTFFAFYQFCQVLGNLFVAIVFQITNIDSLTAIGVLTALCSLGSILTFFLKEPKAESQKSTENGKNENENSPSILESLKIMLRKEFALLIPMILAAGIAEGFYFAALPAIVPDIVDRFYILSVFGTSNLISCIILGRLADKFGRKTILGAGFLAHYAAFLFLSIKSASDENEFNFLEFALCVVLLGFGDAIFNTQAYCVIGETFKSDSTSAFGNFTLILNGGIALACLYFLYTSIVNQAIIYLVVMTLSLAGLIGYNYWIKDLNSL